uniref:SGNH hydrolase-type esterase domain-containing protein n=1 Tax=Sparus aurata TaxID=8175 RepID=A0A671UXC8_SPAAU
MPGVDSAPLQQANKKISDLKNDIQRLSDELQKKESPLSNFMDVASVQSKEIASLSAILRDTVAWDPATGPQLSSCSTPKQLPWTEVLVRGQKRDPDGSASPPGLNLSNSFASLSADNPAHPDDPPAAPPCLVTTPAASLPRMMTPAAPLPRMTTPAAPLPQITTPAAPLLQMTMPAAPPCPAVTPADQDNLPRPGLTQRLPSRSKTSASRRRILRDAVMGCSGALPHIKPATDAIPRDVDTTRPQHSPARSQSTESSQPSSPRPLFTPTTLIIGDSIARKIRFFNTTTHCFPGATLPVIIDKLPVLLCSLPSSINRVIVHVGSNDTARRQSELTKKDFNALFSFLNSCGKDVWLSGPLPTLGRGDGRFSRILSLNTWLHIANHYTCTGTDHSVLAIPARSANTKPHTSNLTFGLFNIRSLTNKGPLLFDLLNDRKFDFFCLTETW